MDCQVADEVPDLSRAANGPVVRFELLRQDGQPVAETQKQAVIGRDEPLDLSRELFDTPIPPGETFVINQEQVPAPGLTLRATVTVEPDYFSNKFFRAVLDGGQVSKGRHQIREALKRTQESPCIIFRQEVSLR